jgi:hypothetical protein
VTVEGLPYQQKDTLTCTAATLFAVSFTVKESGMGVQC